MSVPSRTVASVHIAPAATPYVSYPPDTTHVVLYVDGSVASPASLFFESFDHLERWLLSSRSATNRAQADLQSATVHGGDTDDHSTE